MRFCRRGYNCNVVMGSASVGSRRSGVNKCGGGRTEMRRQPLQPLQRTEMRSKPLQPLQRTEMRRQPDRAATEVGVDSLIEEEAVRVRVHIGAGFDEQANHLEVAVNDSEVEGCLSVELRPRVPVAAARGGQ